MQLLPSSYCFAKFCLWVNSSHHLGSLFTLNSLQCCSVSCLYSISLPTFPMLSSWWERVSSWPAFLSLSVSKTCPPWSSALWAFLCPCSYKTWHHSGQLSRLWWTLVWNMQDQFLLSGIAARRQHSSWVEGLMKKWFSLTTEASRRTKIRSSGSGPENPQ